MGLGSTMPRALLAAAVVALAACTQAGAPQHPFAKENHSLAEQLEVNWNIPTPLVCRRVTGARIAMAPDGMVTGVEPLAPMPADDPCQMIYQSLRRAALISSPFWFPPGPHAASAPPSSLVVRFDPENFKAMY